MPSPFPGMDPFLENSALWPEFQSHLMAAIYELLDRNTGEKYRARIGRREYSSETPLFTSVIREDHAENFVEIRSCSNGRLVTLVEIVSLANRTTEAGRNAYLMQRSRAIRARAGIVEIDLITQGKPILDFERGSLPPYDYTVAVTRPHTPDRYEIYTSTLDRRLPKFKLPLANDDRDTIIDLQSAMGIAYDQGGFARRIDYEAPPPTDIQLIESSQEWLTDWVSRRNLK